MNIRWHAFYLTLIALLLAALLWQGAKLQRMVLAAAHGAIGPQTLYQTIRESPAKYQIVDLRDAVAFEDGHLPQAIRIDGPLTKETPVDRYRRTVIVTEEGDKKDIEMLAGELKLAANLEGGMLSWRMSRLPEVSGLTDIEGLRRGRAG